MEYSSKLLVEGNNDLHIIKSLCEKYSVKESFKVVDVQGIDNVFKNLSIEFKSFKKISIGVVLDADINFEKRKEEIKNLLRKIGFDYSIDFPKKGLILTNEKDQKIGFWIMPNNDSKGMIEDFISFLIPKEDKLLSIVNQTLNVIETQTLNQYSLIHHSKAKIHTWLAWQKDPGTPMGQAITKKYLETNHETCDLFINWLNNMFNT